MRNLYISAIILFALIMYSCGGDDTPPVIPTVEFTHERQIVEAGDEVAFVSTAVDADSFLWEFGDGNSSTDENPTHTYTTAGEFTVTLTVTSTTGDTANSTSTVTVGNRWIIGFSINTIDFNDGEGAPWDANDGPDIFFGYAPSSDANISLFDLGSDIQMVDLPIGGTLGEASQMQFTDEDWTFVMIDNDEPFEDVNASQIMGVFQFNPVTQEADEKDFTTGQDIYTISAQGFSFTVLFELRP